MKNRTRTEKLDIVNEIKKDNLAGVKTLDACKARGITQTQLYTWKYEIKKARRKYTAKASKKAVKKTINRSNATTILKAVRAINGLNVATDEKQALIDLMLNIQ